MLIALPIFSSNSADSGRALCLNNLRRIGQAYQLWGNDYEDRFPFQVPYWEGGVRSSSDPRQPYVQFGVLSNELRSPAFLACPKDVDALPAPDFVQFMTLTYWNRAVSYFVSHGRFGLGEELLAGDKNVAGGSSEGSCNYLQFSKRIPPPLAQWDSRVHVEQGNVLLVNGAAEQLTSPGLKAVASAINQTNLDVHLVAP